MKKYFWDILLYAFIFGIAYYHTYSEFGLEITGFLFLMLLGLVRIFSTVLDILFDVIEWFWDATVNYSKNKRENKEDEI